MFFFWIIYLKCVKGEKEKFNTYKMNKTQTYVRSYPLSFFQKCPILSMRPFIFAKLFTVSDIRRFLLDDEKSKIKMMMLMMMIMITIPIRKIQTITQLILILKLLIAKKLSVRPLSSSLTLFQGTLSSAITLMLLKIQ